jgi:hypothetical protein
MNQKKKRGGAMPGAGRTKTDTGKQFREIELRGLNETLSIIGQNIVEFRGGEIAKSNLYNKISKYQPEFLGAVKNIIEK